jgi:hypothetical protein
VIDTPGRDDKFARIAVTNADTLVTPMNDSFVDFDLIGQVDPETFKVSRPSFYSELIWESRKRRAKADGETIDWVVLRNRMQHIEARNMRRVSEAIDQLSKRVGFRVISGLSERVIYRELFPQGLTMLDSREFGEMGLSHVAARQELREMMAGLALPEAGDAAVRLMAKFLLAALITGADRSIIRFLKKPAAPAAPLPQDEARAILGVGPKPTPRRSARASPTGQRGPSRQGRIGRTDPKDQCRARHVASP